MIRAIKEGKGEVWERETIGSVQEGVCIDGPFGQKDWGVSPGYETPEYLSFLLGAI